MKQALTLYYGGTRLRTGMEAEDLASAIEGFAAIVRIAGTAVYGEQPRMDFTVRAVKPGSLSISFLLEVAGLAQTLSLALPDGIASTAPMFDVLKQWFELLLHLKGKPPSSVQQVKASSGVVVQNASGQTKIVQKNIYNTFNFHDIGRYSERVGRPLKHRADSLEVRVASKRAVKVDKKDATAFRSVRRVDASLENVNEVFLKVISPVFEGAAAWKFSSGRNTLTATVEDPTFLASVQSGRESFRAGDILRVRLRSTQEKVGRTIRNLHALEEVLSHERPDEPSQKKLA